MLIRTDTVRQLIMEPPAFAIAAFQPPEQVPFLPASRSPVYAFPAVPVFKGTPTARADAFFFTVEVSTTSPAGGLS